LGDALDAVADHRPAARELDSLVMQPIRRVLGSSRCIFLSPDGALNDVPVNAFIDEEGRYLIERYAFTYLASGRDLVRLTMTSPPRQNPVVVAAPDYSAKTAASASEKDRGALRSAEMRDMHFHPLRFAAEEGRAVARKLPGAVLLMGEAATEGAVKALGGPLLLHIATHGFFLPDQPTLHVPPAKDLDDFGGWAAPPRRVENPLVRAGLALAGANHHDHRHEDGVLTALEFSQIDLIGTKLVVLSACQTGVGESRSGDGVYGLRRAVAMAGAETQVMSLWNVDDAATSELMQSYYNHLLAGGGRSESLRQAQLEMLKSPDRAHPFYWASFIVSGNPAALDGRAVVPNFADDPLRQPLT
jgi:CHAT domain-containing protein